MADIYAIDADADAIAIYVNRQFRDPQGRPLPTPSVHQGSGVEIPGSAGTFEVEHVHTDPDTSQRRYRLNGPAGGVLEKCRDSRTSDLDAGERTDLETRLARYPEYDEQRTRGDS